MTENEKIGEYIIHRLQNSLGYQQYKDVQAAANTTFGGVGNFREILTGLYRKGLAFKDGDEIKLTDKGTNFISFANLRFEEKRLREIKSLEETLLRLNVKNSKEVLFYRWAMAVIAALGMITSMLAYWK